MAPNWRQAIIVGASGGLGEELARQLAAEGCRVALVARREPELRALADEIGRRAPDSNPVLPPGRPADESHARPQDDCATAADLSPRALTYVHDVTCYEQAPALFQQICRDLGGLDLVIYAAGVMPRILPDEYDFEKDRLNVEVNLLGAIAWLNESALRFGRAGQGTIVGISSVAGDRGRGGYPVYGATKAALNAYLESLRNRIGKFGVAVVTVKPGPIDTPMTSGLGHLPLMLPAREAAQQVLRAARGRKRIAYIPWAWRPIMFILRMIPSYLFQRMKKLNA